MLYSIFVIFVLTSINSLLIDSYISNHFLYLSYNSIFSYDSYKSYDILLKYILFILISFSSLSKSSMILFVLSFSDTIKFNSFVILSYNSLLL